MKNIVQKVTERFYPSFEYVKLARDEWDAVRNLIDACMLTRHANVDPTALDVQQQQYRISAALRELGMLPMDGSLPAPAAQSAAVAFVPIHPRHGPLWSDTFAAGDSDPSERRSGSYERMALYTTPQPSAPGVVSDSPFQQRVQPWMMACFGAEISADRVERNHRFAEEAMELVQANGMPRADAHALVDYVYERPVGVLSQEVGGVMVTLAALCLASGTDMHADGETELARINAPDMIEKIRAKQAAKPRGSALPAAAQPSADDAPSVAWADDDFYGDGSRMHSLQIHPDPMTNAGIIIGALCARLDTARRALAAAAAMQVVQPALSRIKDNAAWAMHETDPRRVMPRSAAYEAPPADARDAGQRIQDEYDARRYRWLRRKFCLIGGADGSRRFNAINLPRPVGAAPDPEACLDISIDRAMGGE